MRALLVAGAVIGVASCGGPTQIEPISPDVLESLTWDQLQPLASKMAYAEGVRSFCGDDKETPLSDFIREIEGQDLPEGLFVQIKTKTDVIMNSFNDASAEYVCTPEMYEQTDAGVRDAQREWTAIKAGTQN